MTAVVAEKQRSRRKITRNRTLENFPIKLPLNPDIFYTIRELTDRQSPYRVASPATIHRAKEKGLLSPNYVGRTVLIKGESVITWIGLDAPLESKKAADLKAEGGAQQ